LEKGLFGHDVTLEYCLSRIKKQVFKLHSTCFNLAQCLGRIQSFL